MASSDAIVKTIAKVFGHKLLRLALKPTFFGHFCAGEDEETIRPTIAYLRRHGVGSILDYAAEADVEDAPADATPLAPSFEELTKAGAAQPARTYKYIDEQKCDGNMAIFLQCIQAVHNVTPEGFAAVKITALGVPALLERLSDAITRTKALFAQLDTNNDGLVSVRDFTSWYTATYGPAHTARVHQMFVEAAGAAADDAMLDYAGWSNMWALSDIWDVLALHNASHALSAVMLTTEEQQLVKNMYARIETIGEHAAKLGVRLMVDAEQTYFQPAIDHATLHLQHKHNKLFPTIFTTYQCYLKDMPTRVISDIHRAQKYGYLFAAKVVRGAYMKIENDRAAARNEPSPICDTIDGTHANYTRVLESILAVPNRNLVVATHNQSSIEFVVDYMARNGIDPASGGIYFAQLLGMADHLTFSLGRNGYKAYKYVPYGPVHEGVCRLAAWPHSWLSLQWCRT